MRRGVPLAANPGGRRPRAQPQPRKKKEAPALTRTDRAKDKSRAAALPRQCTISVKGFTKWVMKQRKLGTYRKPTSPTPAPLVSLAARLATPGRTFDFALAPGGGFATLVLPCRGPRA
ncbi:hypothetical protein B0H16DRAFT_1462338 [Mycena metata]|uniref:Uncharacterized protein n=1 Tax=Mycena metata TaxID=1033252 RepID=A0AAD7N5M7_9AGAR|nr:hypothetical protein B0H16DRAFT_1462338 [Mycena metata]